MSHVYLLAAALIGAAFACQPVINAIASKALGSPIPATVVSVFVTLAASSMLMVATGTVPTTQMVSALPWWIFFGGLIGVLVVGGSVAIVPITGAAVFFVCLIAGQLLGAVLLDHFGAFGSQVREISVSRVVGVGLTFCGVLLVRFGP